MKNILFVCVHNAGRSQMAEAIFNHQAVMRGIELRAVSAGTAPGNDMNPLARQAIRELGISMEGQAPKLLTQEMADSARRIITMGCGVDAKVCPARIYFTDDWGLDDPAGQSMDVVRRIRDEIWLKVNDLLSELVTGSSPEKEKS